MTTLSLPPRGVFVPTGIIFNQQLPSAVLVTWIQLRALAWKGWYTPAFSLAEFASLIGIHPSRLAKHLDNLENASTLSLHPTGSGKLVISFPEQPEFTSDEPRQSVHRSDNPISLTIEHQAPEPVSYFPRQILGYLTYNDDLQLPGAHEGPEKISTENDKPTVSLRQIQAMCSQEVS